MCALPISLQFHDLAVRAIELGTRGHAEQRAGLFDFALHAAAQAHLRVDPLAVALAELVRQRDLLVGVLGRVHPPVEQPARRLALAPRLLALGELVLEDRAGLPLGLLHPRLEGMRYLL